MDLALEAARDAALLGDVPGGAVVLRRGEVLAVAGNRREADGDPTAHAEVIALREAARKLKLAPTGTTPAELGAIQLADFQRWAPVIKATGLHGG